MDKEDEKETPMEKDNMNEEDIEMNEKDKEIDEEDGEDKMDEQEDTQKDEEDYREVTDDIIDDDIIDSQKGHHKHKIKRNVLIGSYDTGGLNMPHIESFCYALKMTWIYKLLDPFNLSPWKILFNDKYRKYGADKIWMMNKDSIKQISIYFNRFWKDILLNWVKLRNAAHDQNDFIGQPIWFNALIKIDNTTIFYEKWCEAGIFSVNDLLNENNEFLSFNQFKETYDINTNFLQFYGHWDLFYMHPFKCSVSNKLIIFQYKILHRILCTNDLLYKCKLKETHLCSFCNETKETIEHIFWECYIVNIFWLQLVDTLHSDSNYELLI
ncbi:uncharacterized protein LOC127700023 [Mytilus californianus]|uniref:uncharacterized protein LOC127700023 n=1 Tax=Mytilus californianus TaxID=6549 RepID=UPI002247F9B8|nr:uncharacterized protein LOC127700023 [Mytilus californianus]